MKQNSSLKFKLVVEQDGTDVHSEELGFQALRSLDLGSRWRPESSVELCDFLARHPDPEISGKVAGNDKISDASLELLASRQDQYIRNELLDNDSFRDWASTDLLLEYARSDSRLAERIASLLGNFKCANTSEIADFFLNHPSPTVRYSMVDDWSGIPRKALKSLQHDSDASVRAMATRKLNDM